MIENFFFSQESYIGYSKCSQRIKQIESIKIGSGLRNYLMTGLGKTIQLISCMKSAMDNILL